MTVSKWEQEEVIPDNILDEFADVLGVTSEFIKKFNEEKSIFNIQNNHNTFNGNSKDQSHQQHYQPTINSNTTEEIAELFEKFFANDKERLDLITNLNKAVLDLANEVKMMKEGK